MNDYKKLKINLWLILEIIIIFIFIITDILSSDKSTSIWINSTCLVFMIFFALKGSIDIFRLNENTLHAKKFIDDKITIIKQYGRAEQVFLIGEWQTALENYAANIKTAKSDSKMHCNINEYLPDSLIDKAANRSYNEQVMNIMTGLGILGTFTGLAFGLHNFDPENHSKIQTLTQGIQAAFYTSIFGISLGIIFNLAYRAALKEAVEMLDNIRDLIASQSISDYETKMLGSLSILENLIKDQTKENKKAVEQIASYLKNQDSYLKNQIEIQNNMQTTIENAIVQSLDSIERRISKVIKKDLIPAITGFAEGVVKVQEEGIDRLSKSFIERMTNLMGNSIKNLHSSIEDVCQKFHDFKDIIPNISELSSSIHENVTELKNTVKYVKSSNTELTNKINSVLDKIDKKSSKVLDSMEALCVILSEINEHQGKERNEISEDLKKLNGIACQIKTDITNNIAKYILEYKINSEKICKIIEKIEISIPENTKKIEKAYNLISNLQIEIKKLSESSSENLTKINGTINNSYKNFITDYNEQFDTVHNQITKIFKGMQAIYKNLASIQNYNCELLEFSKSYGSKISIELEQQKSLQANTYNAIKNKSSGLLSFFGGKNDLNKEEDKTDTATYSRENLSNKIEQEVNEKLKNKQISTESIFDNGESDK